MKIKQWLVVALALALAVGLPSRASFAQAPDPAPSLADEVRALRKEIESLKEVQLKLLDALLRARQAVANQAAGQPAGPPKDLAVSLAGAPARGSAQAKVTLVEFSDYHCPFCQRYVRETWPPLDQEYVQTGKVRTVFKDLPLEVLHPLSFKAHEAAYCAGEQGQYWPMHDRLFASPPGGTEALVQQAQALGLQAAPFQSCLESGKYAAQIRASIAEGAAAGINATPTFLLGLTEPTSGKLTVVQVLRGAQPYATFKAAIDDLLAR